MTLSGRKSNCWQTLYENAADAQQEARSNIIITRNIRKHSHVKNVYRQQYR